jgi:hypothetical protein
MKEWIVIRQRYLISENHSKLPQARTVLFTGVPKKCASLATAGARSSRPRGQPTRTRAVLLTCFELVLNRSG